MVKSRILPHLIPEDLPICKSCIEGKMTTMPFTIKGYRDKGHLELVHIDVCEPLMSMHKEDMSTSSHLQMITPSLEYVYLMHKKSDALDKCIEFKAKLENQLGTYQGTSI